MSTKHTGGPAFPQHLPPRNVDPYTEEQIASAAGMSLRDWFAGIALNAHIEAAIDLFKESGAEFNKTGEEIAHACYQIADVMLEERKKP